MDSQVLCIVKFINALKNKRYTNLLLSQSPQNNITVRALETVCAATNLTLVNFRDEVLSVDSSIVLGGYTRSDFQELLNAYTLQRSGMLVYKADDLISTWEASERKAFFKEFVFNGINYGPPTVLMSRTSHGIDLDPIHNREVRVLLLDKLTSLED